MRIDLFVLNYNGSEYISKCLTSIVEAARVSSHECQLAVVENCSSDGSIEVVHREHPSLPVIEMDQNLVLCSFNKVVRDSRADIVFLLNNDLMVDPSFIDPIAKIFAEHKDAFLVAPKSYLLDGSYEAGRSRPFVTLGLFRTTCRFNGFEQFVDRQGMTFSSGFGGFDRQKFLQLGGFDDLYLPGRLEDVDIAYRAWRKGWKCYYEPKSVVHHIGGKSFTERFGKRGTMELAHRNTFLFMWKNIRDPGYLKAHFLWLLPRLLWMVLSGRPEFLTGLIKALFRISSAIKKRVQESKIQYLRTDREIVSAFQNGN